MIDLKDKLILVTGSGTGVGSGIATTLAKFGADVALIGNYVQLITNGMKVTTFNPIDSEEEIDVVVRYPRQFRKLDQFEKIQIKTSTKINKNTHFGIIWLVLGKEIEV